MSATFLGTLSKAQGLEAQGRLGRGIHYFHERDCTIDVRGELDISPDAHFGYEVMVLTAGHKKKDDTLGPWLLRKVVIEEHAWIASRALLYHCRIGHHAIVGAGAVVKSVVVPPCSLVEGNPAKITKILIDERWVPIEKPIPLKGY